MLLKVPRLAVLVSSMFCVLDSVGKELPASERRKGKIHELYKMHLAMNVQMLSYIRVFRLILLVTAQTTEE